MKIAVLGNCQAAPLAKCLTALSPDITAIHRRSRDIDSLRPELETHDLVLIQSHLQKLGGDLDDGQLARLVLSPRIHFAAFHPDSLQPTGRIDRTPIGRGSAVSRIALFGWLNGLTASQTLAMFNEDTYSKLGFFDQWTRGKRVLFEEGRATGITFEDMFDGWVKSGCFMYLPVHPKGFVIADIARALISKLGLRLRDCPNAELPDGLSAGAHWPVYPEIAARLGFEGSCEFVTAKSAGQTRRRLSLEQFVTESFSIFDDIRPRQDEFPIFQSAPYRSLLPRNPLPKAELASPNPYSSLADYQFWRRAMERVPATLVDPVQRAPFKLSKQTKIATAGSCFAQHISRTLASRGFNYLIAEQAPASMAAEEAHARNFGIFSARYGNLYTARQLVQLFDRAFGDFVPEDQVWQRSDGRYVDPFRPQVEPDGYDTPNAVNRARNTHLASVRQMLKSLDVMVFTLGLTESWRSKSDGAVFPLAPGVSGGAMDEARYEFVNFTPADVAGDMADFLVRLRSVNPTAKMILTVSPVPLIATYEDRHVLVSTTYSKATLRVAAEQTASAFKDVWYFPSYEVITGGYNRGAYFESDLRSVTQAGVDHVMRLFVQHATDESAAAQPELVEDAEQENEIRRAFDIICDEEAIEESVA